MNPSAIEDVVRVLRDKVSVEIVSTPDLLRQAYQLRYQVYCVERGFLAGQNGIECDEYDAFARHAVVRWRQTNAVVGTVQLVLPKIPPEEHDFPIQRICDDALLRRFPRATRGEVSRFALTKVLPKQVQGVSSAFSLLRLALIQGAIRLSAEAGHTHWLAVMEPTLLRLLRVTGLHFEPLGPLVEHHGLRQPAVAELVPTLTRLAIERPVVWSFVTSDGKWYSESRPGFVSLRAARAAKMMGQRLRLGSNGGAGTGAPKGMDRLP